MGLNQEQYERITKYLPRQRGNVSTSNLQLVNAMLHVTENGCKWRALPKSYGNWHPVYVRMNRWSGNGVLRRPFEGLRQENIIRVRMEATRPDGASVKAHPHGTGALKKAGRKASGVPEGDSRQKFTWSPHLTARLFHFLCRRETRRARRP